MIPMPKLDVVQVILIAVVGYFLGVFFIAAASAGPGALGGMLFLIVAIGLTVHFGLKRWAFLLVDAPLLTGLGVGLFYALGYIKF